DVRALSYSYQLRKAGQHSTKCDALLLAAAVLQGHFNVHITRIPPAQMGRERGQRLPHVRAFLCCESDSDVDHVLAKGDSLSVVRLDSSWPHFGRHDCGALT